MDLNVRNEYSNRAALSAANVESNPGDELLATKKTQGLDSRVNIAVTSYRHKKHDPDGLSIKAVLDGIVRAGLLSDDSTQEVKEIRFRSEIVKKKLQEKTIIEITNEGN